MIAFPLQLIHSKWKTTYAVIYSDRIEFRNERIRKVVEHGIKIPYFMQGEFSNKAVVHPDGTEFVRAFIKAYFPYNLETEGYRLEPYSDPSSIDPSV